MLRILQLWFVRVLWFFLAPVNAKDSRKRNRPYQESIDSPLDAAFQRRPEWPRFGKTRIGHFIQVLPAPPKSFRFFYNTLIRSDISNSVAVATMTIKPFHFPAVRQRRDFTRITPIDTNLTWSCSRIEHFPNFMIFKRTLKTESYRIVIFNNLIYRGKPARFVIWSTYILSSAPCKRKHGSPTNQTFYFVHFFPLSFSFN